MVSPPLILNLETKTVATTLRFAKGLRMPFNLVLVLLILGGWFAGRIFDRLRLPAVLGMLLFGLAFGSLPSLQVWPAGLVELEPFLKTFALVVILLRAGLGIRRATLNRIGPTAIALATLPCLCEGAVLTLALRFTFGFDWPIAAMGAFMLSAVSPAVVVPAMLRLAERGLGKRNEVPTLVLAGASVDDVLAITLFSLFTRMSLAGDIVWGDWLHSAALLGVMTVGFFLLERAEPIAHELAAKLSKIWVFAEIVLFVLIGMQVDPAVAWNAGPRALGVLALGLLARAAGVWLATSRSRLSSRERLFCVLANLPKATVQAALGGVALGLGLPGGDILLALAVLAILVTAPLGLLAIRWTGESLLEER